MNRSESIAKLALALSKAQAELKPALKTTENTFTKATYANLEEVWEACREAVSKNELSVVQLPDTESKSLLTILMHSSGEWIQSSTPLLLRSQDMQQLGSAITYARRYALAAMIGVIQADDDGNLASGKSGSSHEPKKEPRNDSQKNSRASNGDALITESQMKYLFAVQKELGLTDAQVKELAAPLGVKSRKELTMKQLSDLVEAMRSLNG